MNHADDLKDVEKPLVEDLRKHAQLPLTYNSHAQSNTQSNAMVRVGRPLKLEIHFTTIKSLATFLLFAFLVRITKVRLLSPMLAIQTTKNLLQSNRKVFEITHPEKAASLNSTMIRLDVSSVACKVGERFGCYTQPDCCTLIAKT